MMHPGGWMAQPAGAARLMSNANAAHSLQSMMAAGGRGRRALRAPPYALAAANGLQSMMQSAG